MCAVNNTETEVRKTVNLLVTAADHRKGFSDELEAFIAATSRVKISKIAEWERIIRDEMYRSSELQGRIRRRILPWGHRFVIPWLDLFSGDGYRRERVIRTVKQGAPNALLFAVLVRRLNDWVRQVRIAATECLPAIAAQTNPDIIIEVLWEVLPTHTSWGRIEEQRRKSLLNLLHVKGVPESLARRLHEATSGPAAMILGQAARNSEIDRFLPSLTKNAIQPAVRSKAYMSLLAGEVSWLDSRKWTWTDKSYGEGRYDPVLGRRELTTEVDFWETLVAAAADPSPTVRRVAGSALIANRQKLGSRGYELAKILTSDPYPSVAERGQFVLDNS